MSSNKWPSIYLDYFIKFGLLQLITLYWRIYIVTAGYEKIIIKPRTTYNNWQCWKCVVVKAVNSCGKHGMTGVASKLVKLATNGTNAEHFQIIIRWTKMYWNNLIWKSPVFVPFEAYLTHFGSQSYHSYYRAQQHKHVS